MGYTEFLVSMPNLSWAGLLPLFLLTLMRIIPIVVLAPFLGGKVGPIPARMGLGIFLALLFLPAVASNLQAPLGATNTLIGFAIKELVIGFILGFFVSAPFFIVQSSGILIDYLRGASIMQAQDPSMQSQASPIGILYNYVLIVLFFQIGGPFLFFDAVIKSYAIVPIDSYLGPLFFTNANPFWKIAADIVNQIVTIGIQLSAPSLISILMAEMFLGIANRLAPQVQIAFLGMSIKSFLGIMMLMVAWYFILKQFTNHTQSWLLLLDKVISYMKLMSQT